MFQMTFHLITLFPESFDSYVGASIIGRAVRNKKIKIKFYNPRDFTKDKHRRVDQKPYGGGPGMVLEPLSVIKAVEKAVKNSKSGARNSKILWLSPAGKQFDNNYAEKVSKKVKDIIIICGRYEGIDARVKKVFKVEEISIGPYVVTGGELPAMIILDTVARRLPGVLGKIESVEENRIASSEVYTRPEILTYRGKKYRVPRILLSGNQKNIEEWKQKSRG
jgi:tRNA (guanine37-N1)-methyltransferase